jgi:hypothetical protein
MELFGGKDNLLLNKRSAVNPVKIPDMQKKGKWLDLEFCK